jgi:hypothetical protein
VKNEEEKEKEENEEGDEGKGCNVSSTEFKLVLRINYEKFSWTSQAE